MSRRSWIIRGVGEEKELGIRGGGVALELCWRRGVGGVGEC